MFNNIHHVAIICSDYEKSKYFYTVILGFTVIAETFREKRESYKLDMKLSNGVQLELFSFPNSPIRPTQPEALGLRHLAFNVENIDEVVLYLRTNGIPVEKIRVDQDTGKKYTFFQDPDHLPLELYEQGDNQKLDI